LDSTGDKIASSIIAQSADVPTLPWSGSRESTIHLVECDHFERRRSVPTLDLKLAWNENDRETINVPMDVYEKACVTDPKKGIEVSIARG
jgi:hypothetical protein